MRIAFITDLHIGLEGEDTYGVDVRANFLNALNHACEFQPELIVLGGDLCFDTGNEAIYHWIKGRMDERGIPYDVIGGNHDNTDLLAGVFYPQLPLRDNCLFFAFEKNGRKLLFLDTVAGFVSPVQCQWLKEQLATTTGEILVFMHHPPVLAGVPFMDQRYALANWQEVWQLFLTFPFPIHIFTGHYHVDKVIRRQSVSVYITPSCFFQIDPHAEPFKVDHYRIGYREIEWDAEGIMTAVRYL